jgi:N utilization substance protein B
MRHKAREIALQALYQLEIHKTSEMEVVDAFLAQTRLEEWHLFDEKLPDEETEQRHQRKDYGTRLEETLTFARRLAQGASTHRKRVDRVIKNNLENWKLGRLSMLTRNVLRLAVYEMCFSEDPSQASHRVIINEALELTDEFIDEKTKGFVNSVLQKVYDRHVLPQAPDPAKLVAEPAPSDSPEISTGADAR